MQKEIYTNSVRYLMEIFNLMGAQGNVISLELKV